MSSLQRCPKCGKRLWVADATTGLQTICSHCGTKSSAPPPANTVDPRSVSVSLQESIRQAGKALRRVTTTERHKMLLYSAVILAVLTIAVTVSFLALREPQNPSLTSAPSGSPVVGDPWEIRHRGEFLAMQADARALVASGETRRALDAYRQIERLAAGHELKDITLKEILVEAKSEQDRLIDMLAQLNPASPENRPTAVPTGAYTPSTLPDSGNRAVEQ